MKFLDVVKEVSVYPVRREASAAFVLGVAGDANHVAEVRRRVLGNATPEQIEAAEAVLCCASPPYSEEEEKRLRYADILLSVPGGPGMTDLRPADIVFVEDPERALEQALAARPELLVALGRRLPGFREIAARQVINGVSRVNAEFSALSGISASIPFLAPLLPAVVGADVLVLTKNQVLMIFRLAAIYGDDLGLMARWKEVAPTIAGAVGWRALARQCAGALPMGLGIPARVAIAFAGTYVVGRTAEYVLGEGRPPTQEEIRRFMAEAREQARAFAARFRRRKPGEPEEIRMLPAGELPGDRELESMAAPEAEASRTAPEDPEAEEPV
ncbi:MAG: hypothetical protein FJX77_01565 [Armatimonadetes bacterium]|nr:hypothetical protein [Armatimonadota bacterium]MBM3947143.1 hypothetical protein [SAR202 cluster bacterium]